MRIYTDKANSGKMNKILSTVKKDFKDSEIGIVVSNISDENKLIISELKNVTFISSHEVKMFELLRLDYTYNFDILILDIESLDMRDFMKLLKIEKLRNIEIFITFQKGSNDSNGLEIINCKIEGNDEND